MPFVAVGDILHEVSNLISWARQRKLSKMLFAELYFTQHIIKDKGIHFQGRQFWQIDFVTLLTRQQILLF